MRRWPPSAAVALAIIGLTALRCFALEIKRSTLSNGATLLVSEQHQLPMVTVAILFDAGSRRDPKGKEGLAQLTAESLTEGTKRLSAAQLNQKIDFMGSELSVTAGQDYAEASITSLKRYAPDTLHLLAAVLTHPALKDRDIVRKRGEQVASIKSDNQEPGYIAEVTFTKTLYGDEPYNHPSEGWVETAEKLTPADVRDFYKQYYRTGGAIIAVVGDVESDQVKTTLEQELAELKGEVPTMPTPGAPAVAPGGHLTVIDRNIQQANVVLGFAGVARSDPDYYRLQVMNYIYGGGGFASRLTREVRSKAGLAYSIGSGFDAGKFPSAFKVALQTKNKSANEAIQMVLEQMRKMREVPISDKELEDAKKFLVGSFPLKLDRQSSIAGFLLQIEFYGLGLDYADRYPGFIDSVTKADVQKVAQQHLHPDSYVLVAAANQKEADLKLGTPDSH